MKEVFFIHQNTKGVKVGNSFTQVTTDYVCARGFKNDKSDIIYNSPEFDFELENYVSGVWWDTYEEGEKELAKLMKVLSHYYSEGIKKTYDKMKEKYPEVFI